MTRGYLCVVEKDKVKAICWLPSDAYLSYYGLEILEAVINGNIEQYVNDKRKQNISECGKKHDPCKGFVIEWINGSRDESEEKGYIYDCKTGVLKAYERGSLLYTVKPEERERYRYIFANDHKLEMVLSYNAETLSYDFQTPKTAKKIAKMSDAELENIVKLYDEERLELDDVHCIMPGHHEGHEVYRKQLRSSKSSKKLDFLAEHSFNKWNVLLCTPFGRYRVIARDFRSETAAVKAIRELIAKEGKEKLFRLADLLAECEEARKSGKAEDLISTLKKRWKAEPWYTGGCNITVESIAFNLRM